MTNPHRTPVAASRRPDLLIALFGLVNDGTRPAGAGRGSGVHTKHQHRRRFVRRIIDARDVPNTPMALSGGAGVPRGCIRLYSVVPLSLEESAGTNLTYDHRVSSGKEEHDQRRPDGSTFASPPGQELRVAIVTCIERTHHGRRRQQRLCGLTPIEFATLHTTAQLAHGVTRSWVPLLAP